MMSLSKEIHHDLSFNYSFRAGGSACAPVVFLLHGRGGTARSMSVFLKAVPKHWWVISPEGRFDDEELGGKSWWAPGRSLFGDKLLRAKELSTFFEEAIERMALCPSRALALGFSQGAGLVSLLGSMETSILAGIGFLSGYQITSEDGKRLPIKQGTRIFIAHGLKDRILPLEPMKIWMAELQDRGYDVCYTEDSVGHKVGPASMSELAKWLESFEVGFK